jgi:fibronectin type 3 domain-containing protein
LILLSWASGCGKVRGFFSLSAPENPHFVTISWSPSKLPVSGYNVYRGYLSNAVERLTPKIVTQTQYVDGTALAGRTYVYYVTSVDSKGLESNPSEKITVVVPAK